MNFKKITKDVKISALGLGTFGMGEGRVAGISDDEKDVEAIRLGIELGITHIDTAERYASGHSEEVVADAIEPFKRRELFITTKVWHNHLRHDDLIASLEESLKRLRQDYVDLYLVHWPNPEVSLEETMGALEYCAEEGWTRQIGVSNFSAELIVEAQSHLKEHTLVADQVHYSLLNQDPRDEILPYCQKNNIILISYTPLARGKLAMPGNSVLDELVEKYDRTHAQISLNWLISQENVVAIPKASNPVHLRENLGAVDWMLDKEDWQRLSESFTIA
ncbi:MAG: aldo/keto reductase [Candidatus Bathyarchaeota archaeon]|jgi:diketogulonate reductase-like aldo/keto reductase|nr:aldo/keto reductase [Candidatus Bathyarchaeota archaeon]